MKTKLFVTNILIVIFIATTTAQVLEQDSLALVAFYNSTGGPNWNNNSNWLTGPVSTWYGVTVEGDRVIEFTLYANNLVGTIPTEIGNLTQIKELKLGHAEGLIGEIPETIGNLLQLEVFVICNCSMTGTITNSICNCSNLYNLSLWENNLTGPIPPEIGNLDSLKFLDLHDNQLTGPIPHELGNCTNLWEVWLNDNQLTGTIPEEVTWLDNLQIMNLSSNQLSGELPGYLSNLFYQNFPYYISLFVSDNLFSGPIPASWGNLSFLIDDLDLSYNNFTSLPSVDYNWIITFFKIEGNKLTFEHIESHYQSYLQGLYYFFDYYPQDDMLEELDTVLVPGSSYSIYSGTGGEFTNYKWFKNNELILESPDADTLYLTEISYVDTGIYYCQADNSLIYFLNLYRKPVHITIDTGTNIITNPGIRKKLKLFPNPAGRVLHLITKGLSGRYTLNIYDMNGRNTFFKNVVISGGSDCLYIDLNKQEQGIYIVELKNSKESFTEKLIINKRGTNR